MQGPRLRAAVAALVIALALFAVLTLPPHAGRAQTAAPATVRENLFGFTLTGLRINHQGQNTITVNVVYRYPADLPSEQYPDVLLIRKDLLQSIQSYPNTTDYWEVYNRRLTDGLYAKYGAAMEALRVTIGIAPHGEEPFPRTSVATCGRPGSAPLAP